ncbi:MAG: DMT family transporter [Candidatus Hadarchaeum sp.]
MKLKEWGAFILLGVIWGSSFMWIKIALREIGPFTLVALRLLWGVLGLLAVVVLSRPSFPREKGTWLVLAVLGLTNTALPFVLISWGELFVDSGVASILNGAVPLFTLVIAHLFLQDERITLSRVVGLVGGFAGIIILMSRDIGQVDFRANILGQLAALAASMFYAGSSVFARLKLRQVSPIVQAAVTVGVADTLIWSAALALESPFHLPRLPLTWLALAWLGVMGSCVAYLLYFYLLHAVGATRATLVTYVLPVVGVVLGIVFLDEQLDWHLVVGTTLIVAGIWIINTNAALFFAKWRQSGYIP